MNTHLLYRNATSLLLVTASGQNYVGNMQFEMGGAQCNPSLNAESMGYGASASAHPTSNQ